jgi:hypothetical protein
MIVGRIHVARARGVKLERRVDRKVGRKEGCRELG